MKWKGSVFGLDRIFIREMKNWSHISWNLLVSKEQYQQLSEDNWSEMTPEEMEQYLGVKYVENKESTEDWGEGYLVVDFPGPDEDSCLRVLFKDKEGNGKMTPSSMSPSGQLMGD